MAKKKEHVEEVEKVIEPQAEATPVQPSGEVTLTREQFDALGAGKIKYEGGIHILVSTNQSLRII